jgi:metal-responsive CopG/Arc/MetJ family transcriptional regulator
MVTRKLAIRIDEHLVVELDKLVANKVFASRSEAIRIAIQEKVAQMRLARECSKLDPAFERAMAEEGVSGKLAEWHDY